METKEFEKMAEDHAFYVYTEIEPGFEEKFKITRIKKGNVVLELTLEELKHFHEVLAGNQGMISFSTKEDSYYPESVHCYTDPQKRRFHLVKPKD